MCDSLHGIRMFYIIPRNLICDNHRRILSGDFFPRARFTPRLLIKVLFIVGCLSSLILSARLLWGIFSS